MTATPDQDVWDALVGHDVAVADEAGAALAATPWRCTACSALRAGGGWAGWSVTFDAPGAVPQSTVTLTLPDGSTVAVFVVPEAATERGTRLVATFTAAAPDIAPDSDPDSDPDGDPDPDRGTDRDPEPQHGGPHG